MYVILVYDIAMNESGAKRLRHVFKLCKRYLNHVQNSVFEGELSESQLFELRKRLQEEIDRTSDSVLIFSSRDQRWMDKQVIGIEQNELTNIL